MRSSSGCVPPLSGPAALRGLRVLGDPPLRGTYTGLHLLPTVLSGGVLRSPRLYVTLLALLRGCADAVARAPVDLREGDYLTLSGLPPPLLFAELTLPVRVVCGALRVWGSLLRIACACAEQALAALPGAAGVVMHTAARSALRDALLSGCALLRCHAYDSRSLRAAERQGWGGSGGGVEQRASSFSGAAAPPWLLPVQAAVLRQLPVALCAWRAWLLPSEIAALLQRPLRTLQLRHWEHALRSPKPTDAHGALRLCPLLLLREAASRGLLDYAAQAPSAIPQLTRAAVHVLRTQINESDLQRALGLRVCAALLGGFEARVRLEGESVVVMAAEGAAFAEEGCAWAQLLPELCTAVEGVLLGKRALGEEGADKIPSESPTQPLQPQPQLLQHGAAPLLSFTERRRSSFTLGLRASSGGAMEGLVVAFSPGTPHNGTMPVPVDPGFPGVRFEAEARALPNWLAKEVGDWVAGGEGPVGGLGSFARTSAAVLLVVLLAALRGEEAEGGGAAW